MGVERMTGTPWHKERVHRKDGDERRYKGRCRHYSYENNHCSYYCGKCLGSAHCSHYNAISEEEFAKRQKYKTKKKDDSEEPFWY